MKNTNISSFKQRLSFNVFRWLAICALICTIGVSIFLWAESLMPAEQSAEQSGALANTIKDKVEVIDNDRFIPLQSVRFFSHAKSIYYSGDTEKLNFTFYPSNATNKKMTYASKNERICTVDANGIVTYLNFGTTFIVCTSVENPNIVVEVECSCGGYTADASVTDLRLAKSSSSTSASITSIKVGDCIKPVFQDQDGRVISRNDVKMSSNDQSILTVQGSLNIYGTTAGTATLTLSCKKANLTKEIEIEVLPSEKIMPTGFVFKQDTVYLTRTTNYYVYDNIDYALPTGAVKERFWIEIGDTSVVTLTNSRIYAKAVGETTVTLTPYANPSQSFTYTVVVREPSPDRIIISGKARIVSGNTYTYTAAFEKDGLMADMTGVIWEVDGRKATITDDGKLVVNSLGKVVIRARSVVDPSIYEEMTVRVSLFASFGTFVRKIIGHFSCFAILGFGFTVVYFLLLRPRFLYAPCALVSGFFVAMMSEIFQLPIFTQGRGPSWVDVMTDTWGVVAGIAVASAIIVIYLIWIRIVSKKQSLKVRRTLSLLSGKTMFLSPSRTRLLTDMQEYGVENAQGDVDCLLDNNTNNTTEQ